MRFRLKISQDKFYFSASAAQDAKLEAVTTLSVVRIKYREFYGYYKNY